MKKLKTKMEKGKIKRKSLSGPPGLYFLFYFYYFATQNKLQVE